MDVQITVWDELEVAAPLGGINRGVFSYKTLEGDETTKEAFDRRLVLRYPRSRAASAFSLSDQRSRRLD